MTNQKQDKNMGALGPYRVLDLTDEKGFLCGRLMADLGAEVIKIEPPGGDPGRSLPPFYKDDPHPEKSLYYLAYNASKKSITLDIETTDGQDIFKKLVKTADFVIESYRPGHMDNLGLGYEDLSRINPRVVVTSISPFGQTGPYRNFHSFDLLCSAMSGHMFITGDPDRAPLHISLPQAYLLGSAEALMATMAAHYYRRKTGLGQHADVAIRDAMIKTTVNTVPMWEYKNEITKRGGVFWTLRGEKQRVLWPCKDGAVSFGMHGGGFGAKTNRELVKWMDSEGMASDFLKTIDWENLDMETATPELYNELSDAILRFFQTHTKKELAREALDRGVMLSPVQTVADISESTQLEARDFWDEVEHWDLNVRIRYPGAFIQITETPCLKTTRAPHIGEHNEDIYIRELKMTSEELAILSGARVI
ncbi:MAG: CoA transferase [Deltaproteobacteria bacterium]|nr:CoA transferase [Deltaproteobacteria bacterium]